MTPSYIVCHPEDGSPVHEGDTITDFRGEPATVLRVERRPDKPSDHIYTVEAGEFGHPFYHQVFDLVRTSIEPEPQQ